MAGIHCYAPPALPTQPFLPELPPRRVQSFGCCSTASNKKNVEYRTPQLLKFAVSGVTEFLRLLSSGSNRRNTVSCEQFDELSISGIDDVVTILTLDYEKAYFVTGMFTSAIYAEDSIFEDPTIKFRGKDLYSRNLKLLLPFFDNPSIELQKIEKGVNSEILAKWKLRTYLKLPWRPLIDMEGNTVYELNEVFKIVRHAESWNISAREAIGQIFTPSFGRVGE